MDSSVTHASFGKDKILKIDIFYSILSDGRFYENVSFLKKKKYLKKSSIKIKMAKQIKMHIFSLF